MATIDSTVAQVLDRHHAHESEDEDALIAELEAEEDSHAVSSLRERRLEQLHAEVTRAKLLKETQHGTYIEIKDEKAVMDITTSTKLCVVHFMKPDFNRCGIMDEKLRILAEKHFDTRFVSINVDNAPFLVVKLGVKVLPCVIAFKDGVSVDRIIGFEAIGYRPDKFTASELEARLLSSGVLVRAKMTEEDDRRRAQKRQEEKEEQYDDDDDWD
jgi:thioredoxin-like negative regulator of GroEL